MAERSTRRAVTLALALAAAACATDLPSASPSTDAGDAAPPDAGAGADSHAEADAVADSHARADADGDSGAASLYDQDGPLPFTTETATLSNGGRTFSITAYLPSPAGLHPVVSLSPGLLQTSPAYAVYGRRLASHGIAMLVRDDPGALTVTTDVAADIAYTVTTWMPGALGAKVDVARVGLAGHSRGGKATLLAAEGALHGKLKAWFGLDPVDAAAFSGGAQARDTIALLGVPTAYLGAQLSSTCSPAADNFDVLFAASAAPSVEVTAVGAGHTQLEDQTSCSACNLCTPAGTADSKTVLAHALRYLTAFFARELLADTRVGAAFEGAGAAADIAAGRVKIVSK